MMGDGSALRFEFRPYRRPFLHPLQTSHGEWCDREGILLRLTNGCGQVGFGEIAPVPWFGSESLDDAMQFCDQLSANLPLDAIFSIPDHLPACQFGFESAWEMLEQKAEGRGQKVKGREDGEDKEVRETDSSPPSPSSSPPTFPYSGLLPAGEAALSAWKPLWEGGYRTFKWKIGVYSHEIDEILDQFILTLPSVKLRLDANGGLSYTNAETWLRVCYEINAACFRKRCGFMIEFLEQPLLPDQFDAMLQLAGRFSTPIALDESVATLAQLQNCYARGWRDVFVIKPAIAGSPSRLRQFFQNHPIDAVFSSVFETAIGQQAGLRLAGELMQNQRAVGYGVNQWFSELHPLSARNPDLLWQHLCNC
jgi:O-succinylbenzoate synthase